MGLLGVDVERISDPNSFSDPSRSNVTSWEHATIVSDMVTQDFVVTGAEVVVEEAAIEVVTMGAVPPGGGRAGARAGKNLFDDFWDWFCSLLGGKGGKGKPSIPNGVTNLPKGINPVWDLGIGPRGRAIEEALGANLPSNFKTWDHFEDGWAVSIKSLNLNDPTYLKPNGIWNNYKRYVDAAIDFDHYRLGGIRISSENISDRVVYIAIPNAPNSIQLDQLQRLQQYGADNSVNVVWEVF